MRSPPVWRPFALSPTASGASSSRCWSSSGGDSDGVCRMRDRPSPSSRPEAPAMRFGLFCSAQADGDGLALAGRGFGDYIDFNVEAEALGFHSSFLVEHHFTGWNQVSATLMLLTCVAMRTTRL